MILFVLKFIFVFTSPPVKELLHRKPELAIDFLIDFIDALIYRFYYYF